MTSSSVSAKPLPAVSGATAMSAPASPRNEPAPVVGPRSSPVSQGRSVSGKGSAGCVDGVERAVLTAYETAFHAPAAALGAANNASPLPAVCSPKLLALSNSKRAMALPKAAGSASGGGDAKASGSGSTNCSTVTLAPAPTAAEQLYPVNSPVGRHLYAPHAILSRCTTTGGRRAGASGSNGSGSDSDRPVAGRTGRCDLFLRRDGHWIGVCAAQTFKPILTVEQGVACYDPCAPIIGRRATHIVWCDVGKVADVVTDLSAVRVVQELGVVCDEDAENGAAFVLVNDGVRLSGNWIDSAV